MTVQIICINKDNGNHANPNEAISHYGWHEESTGRRGKDTRVIMVNFLEQGNHAYVKDWYGNKVFCYVRKNSAGTKFLQTYSNGDYSDNLLELNECLI